jgi:hypothetical protein
MDAASKCVQKYTFIIFISLYRKRCVSKTCTSSLEKIWDFWTLSFKRLQLLYSDWLRARRQRGRSLSPGRVKNFHFSTSPRLSPRPTEPPIQWALEALSPGLKRPGHEVDHSLRASAEIKKIWIYASTSPYTFYLIVMMQYRCCILQDSSTVI